MEEEYIELVNYVQKIPYENKKQMYCIYREFLPKENKFIKFLKPKKKPKFKELIEKFSIYFECSSSEAESYIDILEVEDHKQILANMGFDEKEIKKLIKKK